MKLKKRKREKEGDIHILVWETLGKLFLMSECSSFQKQTASTLVQLPEILATNT